MPKYNLNNGKDISTTSMYHFDKGGTKILNQNQNPTLKTYISNLLENETWEKIEA